MTRGRCDSLFLQRATLTFAASCRLLTASGNCDYVLICTFQNVQPVGFLEFTASEIDLWGTGDHSISAKIRNCLVASNGLFVLLLLHVTVYFLSLVEKARQSVTNHIGLWETFFRSFAPKCAL